MDLACLIAWVIVGIIALYDLIKNNPVNPFTHFCAVFVCIILYLEKVLIG